MKLYCIILHNLSIVSTFRYRILHHLQLSLHDVTGHFRHFQLPAKDVGGPYHLSQLPAQEVVGHYHLSKLPAQDVVGSYLDFHDGQVDERRQGYGGCSHITSCRTLTPIGRRSHTT